MKEECRGEERPQFQHLHGQECMGKMLKDPLFQRFFGIFFPELSQVSGVLLVELSSEESVGPCAAVRPSALGTDVCASLFIMVIEQQSLYKELTQPE